MQTKIANCIKNSIQALRLCCCYMLRACCCCGQPNDVRAIAFRGAANSSIFAEATRNVLRAYVKMPIMIVASAANTCTHVVWPRYAHYATMLQPLCLPPRPRRFTKSDTHLDFCVLHNVDCLPYI